MVTVSMITVKKVIFRKCAYEQRDRRKDADAGACDITYGIGALVSLLPFFYHSGHTVFRLKRFFINKIVRCVF